MSPLYKAAGLTSKRTSTIYEHNDHRRSYGAKVLLRKEIKNGVTVSRVVKQMNKGRPLKCTTETIFSAIEEFDEQPSMKQVEAALGVSRVKIAQLLRRGDLRFFTNPLDGREKLVSRAEVEALKPKRAEAA